MESNLNFYNKMEIYRGLDVEKQPLLVQNAVEEIKKQYAFIGGVSELADLVGTNKSHLIRVFHESVGITPGDFLSIQRVVVTQKLLVEEDCNLEIIAGAVGFSCSNYMCKVFKSYLKTTPITYRKENRNIVNISEHKLDERIYL